MHAQVAKKIDINKEENSNQNKLCVNMINVGKAG